YGGGKGAKATAGGPFRAGELRDADRGYRACPPSGFSALPRDGFVAANRRCLTVDGAGGPVRAGFLAKGGDGRFDGGVEVARVDRAGQAVAFDLAPYRVLELGKYQARVLGVQRLVEFFEHVGGGGVHVGDRLGRDQDPPRRRVGPGHPPDLVAEGRGVGEEQRAVEPVDHQAGKLPRLWVAVYVVVALEARHPAQFGVVRPPGPPEDIEDRQPYGDGDPGQHAKQDDATERRDRQQAFGLALTPQPHRAG